MRLVAALTVEEGFSKASRVDVDSVTFKCICLYQYWREG